MAPFLLVTKSSPPSGGLTKSRVFASHFPSDEVQNEAISLCFDFDPNGNSLSLSVQYNSTVRKYSKS